MTFSVTTSSLVAVSATLATTTDSEIQTLDSYATQQSLLDTSLSDASGLAMVLGGEATAIGADTLADATMMVELDGTGLVGTAEGSTTFVAVAASPEADTAFVTANSFGSLSGADFLVVLTSNTQIIDQGPDASIAVAMSSTTLFGLDFDSTIACEAPNNEPMLDPMVDPADSDQGYGEFGIDIDGNVAVLDLTAQVFGVDT